MKGTKEFFIWYQSALRPKVIRNKWRVHFISFIFLFALLLSNPCEGSVQETDSSAVLNQATALASKGEYTLAKKLCLELIQYNPEYLKAKILLGRLYSWTDQYDSARFYLLQVLQKAPHDELSLGALANVELWSGNPSNALMYCDTGLKVFPKSESFYLKKAKALRKEYKFRQAKKTTDALLKINPQHVDGLKLNSLLKEEMLVNRAGVFYNYDIFSITYAPWNFLSYYMARKTRAGTVLGSVNYANRFSRSGLQYEIDFYPRLSKKMNAYLNAGYSGDSVFPRLRLGSSVYYKLPFQAEIELGMRYLLYADIQQSTYIYTASISKYVNRFWFSLRPFITPKANSFSQIYYLSFRYYYQKNMNSYVTATFSAGRNPYDYYTLDSLSNQLITTYSLQSKRIKLDLYTLLSTKNILKVSVAYDQREYNISKFRDHGIFGLGYERLF